jgi:hypothetical protein
MKQRSFATLDKIVLKGVCETAHCSRSTPEQPVWHGSERAS